MTTPYRGKFHVRWYECSTGETFTEGDMVTVLNTAAGNGLLTSATSTSAEVVGTIQKTIAATDTEYSTQTKVPVLVGDAESEWLFNAASGGAQTEVGQFVDVSTDLLLDLGTAYTYGVAQITKVISSTQVVGKLCKKSGPAITTA